MQDSNLRDDIYLSIPVSAQKQKRKKRRGGGAGDQIVYHIEFMVALSKIWFT